MMVTEKLLFAVHEGSVGHNRVGIIMTGHCLPIACSHGSWDGCGGAHVESGIYACWEFLTDVEQFFTIALGLGDGIESGYGSSDKPNGLYVYEVDYDPDDSAFMIHDDSATDDMWPWLKGGTLRRPTAEELEPLTRGKAPWGGVVL